MDYSVRLLYLITLLDCVRGNESWVAHIVRQLETQWTRRYEDYTYWTWRTGGVVVRVYNEYGLSCWWRNMEGSMDQTVWCLYMWCLTESLRTYHLYHYAIKGLMDGTGEAIWPTNIATSIPRFWYDTRNDAHSSYASGLPYWLND